MSYRRTRSKYLKFARGALGRYRRRRAITRARSRSKSWR